MFVQTLSYLKQTIVECWDQDGDARLTPCCVLNRLKQMEDFTRTEKNIYKETLSQDVKIFCGNVDAYSEDNMLEVMHNTCTAIGHNVSEVNSLDNHDITEMNSLDYTGHDITELSDTECQSFKGMASFVMPLNGMTDTPKTRLLDEC